MLPLFDAVALEANPRSAKAGLVTEAISESIAETPDTFPFKTKGVLAGASDYDGLDRKRYELRFENPHVEGILDGGHNMLAIGTHILALAPGDEKLPRRIKRRSEEHTSELQSLMRISSAIFCLQKTQNSIHN